MDCLFCKIGGGQIPSDKIYEDADFLAFLDIKPVNQGHTLVIPKTHYKDIFELPEEVLAKMSVLIKKLAPAIKDAVGAEGINIAMNNESAAGQVVFHSHIHIIPRHSTDGFKHWVGQPYSSDSQKLDVLQKIKNVLE